MRVGYENVRYVNRIEDRGLECKERLLEDGIMIEVNVGQRENDEIAMYDKNTNAVGMWK